MAHPSEHPISCPGCRASYQVSITLSGASVTCENCGADFVLPDFYRSENDYGILVESPANLPGDELAVTTPKPAVSGFFKSFLLILTGAMLVIGVSTFLKRPGSTSQEATASNPEGEAGSAPSPLFTSIPTDLTAPGPLPSPETQPDAEPAAPPEKTPLPEPDRPAAEVPATGSSPLTNKTEITPPPTSDPISSAPIAEEVPPATAAETIPTQPPTAVTTSITPTPDATPNSSASVLREPGPAPSTAESSAIRKDSRKTLEHFLTSTSADQRLAVTLKPVKAKTSMEAFQQTRAGKPFALTELAFLTEGELPDSKWHFHLYNVLLADQEAPIPVAVEQTADGYRIDWHAFHESYTHQLRAFFAAPSEKPGRFRVVMRRAHYFGPPVHGQDTARIAYSIEPPARDETFYAWVDKESLVYQEKLATGERASWEAESYLIVELLWKGDEKRGRWVGLSRILADNWRGE